MITFRSKTDVTDADAIFSEINSRFIAAIMSTSTSRKASKEEKYANIASKDTEN